MKIRVTGVPEHFNLPWNLCIEENLFTPLELEVTWKNEPSGTGAICKALRNDEVDMAVSLTEGIILDIEKGNPSTIMDVFVKSPLIWGIHTAADRKENSIEDFSNPKYAISRFQSGSHLIAKLQSTRSIDDSQWKEIQNLDNAIVSLSKHETDVFFWEKAMTSPFVEKKILKRIGEFPTPWPSFVIVARNNFLKFHSTKAVEILRIVRNRAKLLQQDSKLASLVSQRFSLPATHSAAWSETIQWNLEPASSLELDKIKNNVINSMA